MPIGQPATCPGLSQPRFLPISSQKLQDAFLQPRWPDCRALAQRRGVGMGGWFLGGLNQVFHQFRWRGTERLFSAQFNMIGLTPRPEPFPFHHGPYNNRRVAEGPSRCAPGEERRIYKVTTTSVQFSCSVVSDFATPWTAARQASLSITNSWNLLKLVSIESVMPSNHLVLCHPLLLPPSIFPSIRVFSNESVLRIRWPKYWSFSFCSQM